MDKRKSRKTRLFRILQLFFFRFLSLVERAHVADILILGLIGLPIVHILSVVLARNDGEGLSQVFKRFFHTGFEGHGGLHYRFSGGATGQVAQQAGRQGCSQGDPPFSVFSRSVLTESFCF